MHKKYKNQNKLKNKAGMEVPKSTRSSRDDNYKTSSYSPDMK